MKEIEELIQKFEDFKLKGMKLTESDIFDWICLQDSMDDKAIELTSQYYLEKEAIEWDSDSRFLVLSSMKTEDGKKMYTDSQSKAMVDQELRERREKQIVLKAIIDRLKSKSSKTPDLTNAVKLYLKKDCTV